MLGRLLRVLRRDERGFMGALILSCRRFRLSHTIGVRARRRSSRANWKEVKFRTEDSVLRFISRRLSVTVSGQTLSTGILDCQTIPSCCLKFNNTIFPLYLRRNNGLIHGFYEGLFIPRGYMIFRHYICMSHHQRLPN